MKKIWSLLSLSLFAAVSFSQSNINLYPDSLHTPFIYGVTSGDPTDSSVMIWAAIADDTTGAQHQLVWQLATDSTFTTIIQSDSVVIDRSYAYTARIDVQGLQPYSKYCYRFISGSQYSVTGYTETAPNQLVDSLKFALVSCSSLYSGYFNSYRQIANNKTINAIIHVGDFIYDFIDPQERIRIPQPEPVEPVTLQDWENRYRLYMLDPDLREARRKHPWVQMWDNHDVPKTNNDIGICTKAYFEFSPVRQPSEVDSTQIYRRLSYGPLAEIFIVDDWLYADREIYTDSVKKMLPDVELHWLMDGLDSSTAVWKIVAVSKYFCPWNLDSIALPGAGLDDSWQGYPETRDSVLSNIAQRHINNPVMVSGDLHMNIVSDLSTNPFDSTIYNKATGSGGLGVEVNGISISRGNLDESGIPYSLASSLNTSSFNLNPQQRYLNMFDNGYALLTLSRDSMIARMQLCPILFQTDSQRTDTVLYCMANDNHWLRRSPTTGIKDINNGFPFTVIPNPSYSGLWRLRVDSKYFGSMIEVTNAEGQAVYNTEITAGETRVSITSGDGIYFLRVHTADGTSYVTKLVKLN